MAYSDRAAGGATTVGLRADARENQVHERRERAQAEVAAADARHVRRVAQWRASRSRWIAMAAVVFALACALIAAVATAMGRAVGARSEDRLANAVGIALGVAVMAYLSGLLGALLWTDAWVFSWRLVAAAVIGVVGAVVAVVLGWWRAGPLVRARWRLGRSAVPVGLALLALTAIPAAAAAALAAPEPARIDARVLVLAAEQRTGAPMPERVQALRERATRLEGAADDAQSRANSARTHADGLASQRARAQATIDNAQSDVDRLSNKLARAQADYDDFQELLDEPDLSDEDLGLGDDDLDLEDGYDPGLSPTTEDFGSGSGSIGFCNDGTLSDSIGRPERGLWRAPCRLESGEVERVGRPLRLVLAAWRRGVWLPAAAVSAPAERSASRSLRSGSA